MRFWRNLYENEMMESFMTNKIDISNGIQVDVEAANHAPYVPSATNPQWSPGMTEAFFQYSR